MKRFFRRLKFEAGERIYDLAALAFPAFVVTGILVACFRFWWWLSGLAF